MIDRSSRHGEVLREKMEQQAFSVQERGSTQQSSRHERYQTVSWDISHSPYERGDEPSRHLSTGVMGGGEVGILLSGISDSNNLSTILK